MTATVMTKLKIVTSILLAVGVLEGGGLLSYRAVAKEGPAAKHNGGPQSTTIKKEHAPPSSAKNTEVQKVLDEYRSICPTAKDLGIFQLDWVPTLREAKEIAAKEQRPIFFIMVLNPFGNLYSGHC